MALQFYNMRHRIHRKSKSIITGLTHARMRKRAKSLMLNGTVDDTQIADIVAQAKHSLYISIDLFDTLIVRDATDPDDPKRLAALRKNIDPDAFTRLRNATEAHLRSGSRTDISINQIYSQLHSEGHTSVTADDEFRADMSLLRTRPGALDLLARLHFFAPSLITDTFYTLEQIEYILEAMKLRTHLSELYVSSQTGMRKDNGTIFSYIIRSKDVNPSKWTHIGDNFRSDRDIPNSFGIQTILVPKDVTAQALAARDLRVERTSDNIYTALIATPALRAISSHIDPIHFPPLTPQQVGYSVFGPIVSAFVFWLARTAYSDNVDLLLFAARDGYMLKRAFDRLAQLLSDRRFPNAEYLLTSRVSALAAAQYEKFAPLQITGGAGFDGTLAELLKARLNFSLPDSEPDRKIILPRDTILVTRALINLRTAIQSASAPHAAAYRSYVNSLASEYSKPALVDIGYSGTIQHCTTIASGIPLTGYYFYSTSLARRDISGRFRSFYMEDADTRSVTPVPVRHNLLMESAFAAPQGSVLSHSMAPDGRFEFTFAPHALNAKELKLISALQDGAIDYLDELVARFGSDCLDFRVNRSAVDVPLSLLASKEIHIPSDLWRALRVDDTFTGRT
jgi:FMN phosphatase YigB (HAD superfamily)